MSDLATIEALETALLGAALCRDDIRLELLANAEPDWWQSIPHRRIFMALQKLVQEQRSVDWPNMMRSLREDGRTSLVDCIIEPEWAREAYRTGRTLTYESLATDHIPALRNAYQRRRFEMLSSEILERLSRDDSAGAVGAWVVDRIQSIMTCRGDDRPLSDAEVMQRMIDDSRVERGDVNEVLGYSTGVGEIERTGFRMVPGELVIVGARTSHGKSVLGRQFADAASLQAPTLVFSLEPGERGWADRRAMSMTGKSPLSLRARQADAFALDTLDGYPTAAESRPLFIAFGRPRTVHDILHESRAFKARYPKLGVVVIDQLYNIVGWGGNGRESRDLAPIRITHELREGFRMMNVCCIALHQLNRTAKNGEPVLESLADSTRLEQEANSVLLAWRPGFQDEGEESTGLPDDTMKVKIAKWRDAQRCVVDLPWNGAKVTAGTFHDPYVQQAKKYAQEQMRHAKIEDVKSAS